MGRTFASLTHRNYRIWFFASLVGNIGTWMQFIAQDWIVLAELTKDNAFVVGLVSALQLTPMMLFLPFTGLLADRFDKRKILVMTQGALGLFAAGLGILVLMGEVEVWHVAAFAFASGTAASIDNPSRSVFVSELVPAEDLPNAVGLNSTSFNLGRLIGPGAAGMLIAVIGSGWVFLVNAATFGFTIAAVLAVRPSEYFTKSAGQVEPAREINSAASRRGRFREGLRYVCQRPDLAVIFFVAGTVSCLCMNYGLTSAAMARAAFGLEAGEYGILGSLLGAGSLGGALLAARRSRVPRVRTVVIAAALCGVMALVNAVMPTYASYAASLVFVGFTALLLFTSANTAVQVSTAPEIRGRVMSLYQTVIIGTAPIGLFIAGWICESVSPRWGVGIGAVASFAVVLGAFVWGRRHWGVEVRYSFTPRPRVEIIGPVEREQERLRAERLAREVASAQGDRTPGVIPR
jgi:putative transmembrane efflux protein